MRNMRQRPVVPFPDDPIDEIFLPEAPLVAVVAQVRFPPIASIAREDFIGPFQEEIRSEYPVLQQLKEMALVVGPQGLSAGGDAGTVWRFRDKADEWGVSLAPAFIALETSAYTDRTGFVRRFHAVLRALMTTINPATIERFGLRYADRIVLDRSEGTDELSHLVRGEASGVATVPPGGAARLIHTLNDSHYELDGTALRARWGLVPPNMQLDPFHGEAVPHPSWLLDLDMFTSATEDFDVDVLARRADDFAWRIYAFFSWVVEDELLRRCGGAL